MCVGVNPSTATPEKLDRTVTRVEEYARRNQHDSWVMLNLYAQRSTDPKLMHDVYLPELKAENERHIAELIGGRTLTLLAAWGEPIMTRPYLPELLAHIVTITDASLCEWISIGELTKSKHPRHPSHRAVPALAELRYERVSPRPLEHSGRSLEIEGGSFSNSDPTT